VLAIEHRGPSYSVKLSEGQCRRGEGPKAMLQYLVLGAIGKYWACRICYGEPSPGFRLRPIGKSAEKGGRIYIYFWGGGLGFGFWLGYLGF
jgi:hypothetical protein